MIKMKEQEILRRSVDALKRGFIKPSICNFVETVWGGNRIEEWKGLTFSKKKIGESWECSTHPKYPSMFPLSDGFSVSLARILDFAGEELMGRDSYRKYEGRLPILIKFLDAGQDLSVQVHPSDEKAEELGEEDPGKTEAWVILQAEPGSCVYLGFKEDVEKRDFQKDLLSSDTNIAAKYMNAIPVVAGKVLLVPAGTLHAVGKGVFLFEIQQTSGTTYRVWDWNRKPERQLHIPQAMKCLHFQKSREADFEPGYLRISDRAERLIHSRYFSVERLTLRGHDRLGVEGTRGSHVLTCIEGRTELASQSSMEKLSRGESLVVPDSLERYTIHATKPSVLFRSFFPPGGGEGDSVRAEKK